MADVTVTFAGDTSGLDAAIAKIKAETQQLDPAMVELGGRISAAFKKIGLDPGKAFATMDPKEQQALAQYGASLEKVTEATKKVGDESTRTGINVGNMAERMVVRFALIQVGMKAVEESAKTMWAAVAEPVGLEQAQNRFQALSAAGKDFGKELKIADEVARATGVDVKELYPAILKLEDAGVHADTLRQVLTNISEASKTTGVNLEHVADLYAKANLGEASIPQLRELAHLSGQYSAESLKVVDAYEKQAKSLTLIDTKLREALHAQEEWDREQEKAGDASDRQYEKRMSYQEKIAQAQGKDIGAMLASGAGGPETQVQAMQRLLKGGSFPAIISPELIAQYKAGLKEMSEATGTPIADLNKLVAAHKMGYQEVINAGLERHREEVKNWQETETEANKSAQAQIAANKEAQESAKLAIGPEIVDNFTKANAQAALFEKQSATISGWWDKTGAAIKDATEHGAGLQALMGVVSLGQLGALPTSKAGGFQGGSASLLDQLKAAFGFSTGPSGKSEITETNSTKIEEHLNKLVQVFGGT